MPEIHRKPRAAAPLEREIQQQIRQALGLERDLVLWRNAMGFAEVIDGNGLRKLHYGLGVGSADLLGILRVPVVDTRAPHGIRAIGRFVGLEVKRPGEKLRPEQVTWAELVRGFGGFTTIVRSVDEAIAALERARNGGSE